MLSRFRRANSNTPNNKNGTSRTFGKDLNSPSGVRRYNSSSSSKNNNGSHHNNDDSAAAECLHELRNKLDRLDELTDNIRKDILDVVAKERQQQKLEETGSGNNNGSETANKMGEKKSTSIIDSSISENENNSSSNTDEQTDVPTPQSSSVSPPSSGGGSTEKSTTTTRTTNNAKFAPISANDTNEIIEIIRRIAELVVLSERRAGQILSEVAAAAAAAAAAKEKNKEKGGGGDGKGDDGDNESVELDSSTTQQLDEDAALPYLAPFELFCERNALANIVNIVTGVAFATSSSSDGSEETSNQYLPPLSIATQSIQSVSILIQNVSRATSLYLLLSNNRVNDLIRLPLDLYKLAELDMIDSTRSKGTKGNNAIQQQQQMRRMNISTYTSPEISELTTHFVSFLKSLAMRVNAETLQFFLSFPMVTHHRTVIKGGYEEEEGGNGSCDEDEDNDDEKISSSAAEATADDTATNDSSLDETNKTSSPKPATPNRRPSSYMEQRQNVDFPLYARALEFCSPEQDSFVRVTAMNVCMNIIRLATVEESGNGNNHDDDGDDSDNDDDSTHSNVVPTGALQEAITLPLQDRIAIAQYACHPRRVSDLVSPLCSRLTSQFGQVEGTVRSLEELNNNATKKVSTTPDRKKGDKNDEMRDRLTDQIRDLIANVQDELLLLDDLLKVGLISLNEQAIEMMLATFVYPMLLQPLLLPLHRFSSSKNGSASQDETPKKARKPTITLQSPPPLSSKKADNNNISSKFEKEATISSDPESDTASINNASPSNGKDLHSSDEMDLAPSKTALFGLSVIFHAVSNPTFCHLLLTALLHPLSPQASGGLVISCAPQITLPVVEQSGEGDTISTDNSQLEIRMEETQMRLSKRNEDFQQIVPVYNFGTRDEERERENDDAMNTCIFILAPALVDMLRNHTGLAGLSDDAANPTDREATPTRPNPYRNILISAINGSEEMVSLQALAVAAVQSALQSIADKSIFKRILFASKQLDVSDDEDHYVAETLRSFCQSVVNKSVTYDGWWKVKFNTVAARILVDTVRDDSDSLRFVESIMSDVYTEAAEYLMTFPSLIDAKSRQAESPGSHSNQNKQHLDSWLLDRFYFDQPDKATNSVVENVCYLKEEAKDIGSKEQYRYGLEVLSTITVSTSTDILCESSRVVENMLVSAISGNTPFHCAASWALACLYLDAFCIKIATLKASFEDQPGNCLSPQRQLSYISASASDDEMDSDLSMSLAHVSSKFAIAMLDEAENV